MQNSQNSTIYDLKITKIYNYLCQKLALMQNMLKYAKIDEKQWIFDVFLCMKNIKYINCHKARLLDVFSDTLYFTM
jgi:hypothetical protein